VAACPRRHHSRLPGRLAGWTAVRDLKPIPDETFREWWKKNRGVG
jgi:L-lactate dehydrogenase complex protein LldF